RSMNEHVVACVWIGVRRHVGNHSSGTCCCTGRGRGRTNLESLHGKDCRIPASRAFPICLARVIVPDRLLRRRLVCASAADNVRTGGRHVHVRGRGSAVAGVVVSRCCEYNHAGGGCCRSIGRQRLQ